MMKPLEISITTDRMTLAALEWGNSQGETILAIHGWLDNAASFECLAEEMNLSTIRLLAIDLPGHGLSDRRPEGQIYHLMDYIVDIVGVIKSLNLTKLSLLGHSLGGIIAMLTAAAVPGLVHRLILLDSFGPMVDKEEAVAEQLKKAISKICLSSSRPPTVYPTFDEAVEARLGGFGKIKRSAAEVLLKRGLVRKEGGYVWSTDARLREPSLVRLTELQVKGFMAGIECPVCLIAASKGYVSLDETKNLRLSYLSNIETHEVSGHHHFHLDGDVAQTARIVSNFINKA